MNKCSQFGIERHTKEHASADIIVIRQFCKTEQKSPDASSEDVNQPAHSCNVVFIIHIGYTNHCCLTAGLVLGLFPLAESLA